MSKQSSNGGGLSSYYTNAPRIPWPFSVEKMRLQRKAETEAAKEALANYVGGPRGFSRLRALEAISKYDAPVEADRVAEDIGMRTDSTCVHLRTLANAGVKR